MRKKAVDRQGYIDIKNLNNGSNNRPESRRLLRIMYTGMGLMIGVSYLLLNLVY